MEAHHNDIGTILRLTVRRQDGNVESGLGLATNLYIYLTPPSGVDKTKAAVLSSNGSDGKMQYVTVNGDLDETGSWQIQGYIKFSNSQIFKTSVRQFNVLANLVP